MSDYISILIIILGLIFFLVIVPKIKKKELNEKKEKELLLLDIKKKLTIILDKKGTSAIGKNYFGAPIKELEELYRDVAKSYAVNNMDFPIAIMTKDYIFNLLREWPNKKLKNLSNNLDNY